MAAVPFEYDCNVPGAFMTNPGHHPIGWVTALDFGPSVGALKADLTVTQPVNGAKVLDFYTWQAP